MNVALTSDSPLPLAVDALVIFQAGPEPKLSGVAAEIDVAAQGALSDLCAGGDFSGRAFETATIYRPAGMSTRRLVLVGTGPSALTHLDLWRLAAAATRGLKARGVRHLGVVVPESGVAADAAVLAIATGVAAGNFEADRYRGDRKPDRRIEALTLVRPRGASPAALEAAARRAQVLADAHAFARELVNEPSNRLTPTRLAACAQEMARGARLECELIDANRARELKMGAFLSVAQGSAEPPVLIVLRYRGGSESATPRRCLALVGKGITFDTGGISIKPAAGMEWMKCDMAGGAAVLGAMQAIAALRPPMDVIALVPATENMPGGRAQKPGDVQTAMSGKTIEVLNTDAEGRLVLADALTYAAQLGATHLVDAATLTGAVVVALGNVNTGVFANSEEFYRTFCEAQRRTGEKMWRLPLDAEYGDQIKGTVGDILNTGGRWGGAITAAMFLKEFVGETPWIHLDIAGTAWLEENKAWAPKGPTGAAVYTLAELACVLAEASA